MLRGEKRPIQKPEQNMSASIHNRFDIEVVDAVSGEIRQKAVGYNVICNTLWTMMFSTASSNRVWNKYIHYGTGSGTPAATDTSLFTFGGYIAISEWNLVHDSPGSVAHVTGKGQLLENQAVGAVLTEVGLAYNTTASTIVTHAMLQDMNGNPIAITKTATDIINIYATVYVHYQGSYNGIYCALYNDSVNSGHTVNYGLLGWLVGRSDYIHSNMTETRGPGDENTIVDGSTYSDASTKTRRMVFDRTAAATNNLENGTRWIVIATGGYSERYLTRKNILIDIPTCFGEYSITSEAIGTGDGETTQFPTKFELAHDLTVYVNGVATNDFTEHVTRKVRRLDDYLIPISGASRPGNLLYNTNGLIINSSSDTFLDAYFYNPFWQEGIATLGGIKYVSLACSDDMVNWEWAFENTQRSSYNNVQVPAAYQYKKYWHVYCPGQTDRHYTMFGNLSPVTWTDGNAIHFNTAPAAGAIITADYTTPLMPKDENHVFDLTVTITVGEYSEL